MDVKINKNSPTPVYYQIQKHIQHLIKEGELCQGDKLPSERELSKELNVSRTTVRKAISNLVTQGYCEKKAGRGLFVSGEKIRISIQGFKGFTKFVNELDYKPSTEVINKEIINPPDLIKDKLEINKEGKVLLLKRLRLINQEPAIVETTYLSLQRMPGLENYNFKKSLYSIIENEYNIKPYLTKGVFNISTVDENNAHLLNIPLGSAVLKKEAVVVDRKNKPVEYIKALYRSDKFSFYVESARS